MTELEKREQIRARIVDDLAAATADFGARFQALRKLAVKCAEEEAAGLAAADKAETALAEYVEIAVARADARSALRERFRHEAGGEAVELTEALEANGTATSAIRGELVRPPTRFSELLAAAVRPVLVERWKRQQDEERRARDERRAHAEAERQRLAEEARRAGVAEEQRRAEGRAQREQEEQERRRRMLEAAGLVVTRR